MAVSLFCRQGVYRIQAGRLQICAVVSRLSTKQWLASQVSRLILLAGANANAQTNFCNYAPALCIAAQEGHLEMVNLVLEFGADVSFAGDDDIPALSYASRRGQIKVIDALIRKMARVGMNQLHIVCDIFNIAFLVMFRLHDISQNLH